MEPKEPAQRKNLDKVPIDEKKNRKLIYKPNKMIGEKLNREIKKTTKVINELHCHQDREREK